MQKKKGEGGGGIRTKKRNTLLKMEGGTTSKKTSELPVRRKDNDSRSDLKVEHVKSPRRWMIQKGQVSKSQQPVVGKKAKKCNGRVVTGKRSQGAHQ